MNTLTDIAGRLLDCDWALATWTVGWVSAWASVILRTYLSRSTRRPYVARWAMGWAAFSLSQAAAMGLDRFPSAPVLIALQLASAGVSTVFLVRGCLRISVERRWRNLLKWAMIPILVWSGFAALMVPEKTWSQLSIYALLAGACGYTALLYWRSARKSRAAGILAGGFSLWAAHSMASPFLNLSPILDLSGQIVSGAMTLMIAIGLTVFVKEEAELSEQKYRGVLHTAADAIFIVDLWSLEILDANEAACRLTKRTSEQLTGVNIMELCPDLSKQGDNLLERRGMFSAVFRPFNEFHMLAADGGAVICEGDTNLMHWHGMPVLQIKVHEVDKGRKIGQMVRRAEKLSSLGRLVAGVAHELNNPLAVVVGYSQIIAKQVVHDEKLRSAIQKILHEGERAAKIVRELLLFARPCEPQMTTVDINHIVRSVMDGRESDLRDNKIEVEVRLAPKLSRTKADPFQIEQVLNNLVGNATHAMTSLVGFPRKLTVVTEETGFFIKIYVMDTGEGVPPAIQERIFEPFFTTKPPGKGTGLGLSICHTILEEHHGRVRLDPTVEGGAIFIVELPVVRCEEPAPAPQLVAPQPPVAANTDSRPRRLLVVDDEPGIRDVLQEVLSSMGYIVDTAANGVEAVRCLKSKRPDLIISDLCMPEMDGPALHRHVLEKYAPLAKKMVFVTGDTVSPTSREFLESTGVRWLSKPFNIHNIEETVRDMLQERAFAVN